MVSSCGPCCRFGDINGLADCDRVVAERLSARTWSSCRCLSVSVGVGNSLCRDGISRLAGKTRCRGQGVCGPGTPGDCRYVCVRQDRHTDAGSTHPGKRRSDNWSVRECHPANRGDRRTQQRTSHRTYPRQRGRKAWFSNSISIGI